MFKSTRKNPFEDFKTTKEEDPIYLGLTGSSGLTTMPWSTSTSPLVGPGSYGYVSPIPSYNLNDTWWLTPRDFSKNKELNDLLNAMWDEIEPRINLANSSGASGLTFGGSFGTPSPSFHISSGTTFGMGSVVTTGSESIAIGYRALTITNSACEPIFIVRNDESL